MIDNSWPACTGNADGIEPLNCHRHRLAEKNNQFCAGRRLETSHTCPASPRTVVQLSRSAPLPRLPRSRTGSLCSVLHFGLLLHCCLLCCSSRWRCLRQAGVCSCRLSDGDVPQYCSALAPRHQCAFFRALSVGSLRALFIISAIFEWLIIINEQNALRYATSVDWCNSSFHDSRTDFKTAVLKGYC